MTLGNACQTCSPTRVFGPMSPEERWWSMINFEIGHLAAKTYSKEALTCIPYSCIYIYIILFYSHHSDTSLWFLAAIHFCKRKGRYGHLLSHLHLKGIGGPGAPHVFRLERLRDSGWGRTCNNGNTPRHMKQSPLLVLTTPCPYFTRTYF